MFPRIFGLVLSLTLVTPAPADVYVATHGDDANAGTPRAPLRSLEAARAMMRQQQKHGQSRQTTTVWIAGGTYYLAASFEFSADDSGDKAAPVVYRAVAGQQVRLVGGRRIPPEAWAKLTAAKVLDRLEPPARANVVQADLHALGVRDFGEVPPNGKRAELFCNDRPMTLARWPNEGFATIASVVGGQPFTAHGVKGDKAGKFTYQGDRPSRWARENDLWLQGYWFWDWADQYQQVAAIDTQTRTITLKPPYHTYGYRKGMRFYAVNALAELDSPGEWYLDRETGLLYLWPPEPTAQAHIVFSLVEAPLVLLKDASHVLLRDLTIEATRGSGVEVRGGEGIRIAGCTIRNTGGCGVIVTGGRGHAVVACDIYQTGAGGIRLSGGDRRTLTSAGHVALNNHIHHYARLRRTYAAAIQLDGVGNRGPTT